MTKFIWQVLARIVLLCPAFIRRPAANRMAEFLVRKYARLTIQNQADLPPETGKPYIFIANHLSNADALVLGHVLRLYRPFFLAGVKLAREVNSRLMLDAFNTIPVRPDTADHQAVQKALESVRRGQSIMVFPEGTRSRSASLQEGKRGIVLLARLAGVPVIPVGLEGTEHLCPINDQHMGEEFFQTAAVRVVIGSPLCLPEASEGERKKAWEERTLDYLMGSIASLLSPAYQGVYRDRIAAADSNDEQPGTSHCLCQHLSPECGDSAPAANENTNPGE